LPPFAHDATIIDIFAMIAITASAAIHMIIAIAIDWLIAAITH